MCPASSTESLGEMDPDINEQAPWNPDLDYIIPPSTKENLFLFFFPPRLGNEDCKMKGKHLLE